MPHSRAESTKLGLNNIHLDRDTDFKPRTCECRDLKEISGELVGWKDYMTSYGVIRGVMTSYTRLTMAQHIATA